MPRRSQHAVLAATIVVGVLGASDAAQAQALCGPGFGTSALELCVTVATLGASDTITGVSPLAVVTTVGDYSVNLTATLIATAGGIEVNLAGNVDKIGNTMPTEAVIITAEGGRTAPLPGGTGQLVLAGAATGTAQVQLGGAAGFAAGPGGNDLSVTGFPAICDVGINGGGAFECIDAGAGVVAAGSVAVRNTTTVNINDQFETVDIPGGVGAGEPVFPAGTSREMVLCEPVVPGGVPEHFPIEQFVRSPGEAGCPPPHFHMRNGIQAFSLEGGVVFDNPGCGMTEVANATLLTVGVVKNDMALPGDYDLPDGEGLLVYPGATLTVPTGTVVTVTDGAKFTNLGNLVVDGEIVVTATGIFTNGLSAVLDNADNTINNFGTLNNLGTINNSGTITNQAGGVVNNTGTLTGNPIMMPEPTRAAAALAALPVLGALAGLRARRGLSEA